VAVFLSLIAGAKILLLMPCWLLGVLVYRTIQRRRLSERTAMVLWTCSLVAAVVLIKSSVAIKIHDALQSHSPHTAALLAYSGSPLTDYALAILVAVNFFAMAHARRFGRILVQIAKPIRLMASFTLTTYLFHLPLLVLFWDVLHASPGVCLLALTGSIVAIGSLTEHRRRDLRAALAVTAGWLFSGLRPAGAAGSSAPSTGVEHSASPDPVRLREANSLEPDITQHGFDTAAVRSPPVGRVVS
jgi:hypothetical protein